MVCERASESHSLNEWPFRGKGILPLPVFVYIALFPYYIHNWGENVQGTVWNVRGPSCFNNTLQLCVMTMTSSPPAEKKTIIRWHFLMQMHVHRVKFLPYLTHSNWLVCCMCTQNWVKKRKRVLSLEVAQTMQEKAQIISWQIRFHFPSKGS